MMIKNCYSVSRSWLDEKIIVSAEVFCLDIVIKITAAQNVPSKKIDPFQKYIFIRLNKVR